MSNPKVLLICGAEVRHVGDIIARHLTQAVNAEITFDSDLLGPAAHIGYIDSLLSTLGKIDFVIFVMPPTDGPNLGARPQDRDNFIFELGVCIAKLGRGRCLLVVTKGSAAKLGSDLIDLRYVDYELPEHISSQTLGQSLFSTLVYIERAIMREKDSFPSSHATTRIAGPDGQNIPSDPPAAVFLSYASKDRELASSLALALAKEGISVWWDRTIPPGKTFDEVIETALTAAKCVIVLWTDSSVRSEWVKNEAREGMRRRILIPAVNGNVTIPFEFRHIHAADVTGWPVPNHPGFESLIKSVAAVISSAMPEEGSPGD